MENKNLTFCLKAELINKKTGQHKQVDHLEIYGPYGSAAVMNYIRKLEEEGEYYLSDNYSYYQIVPQL